MKQASALWFPFFFLGLLFACARFGDASNAATAGARVARAPILVHKIKVTIASEDRLRAPPYQGRSLEPSKRMFAEDANPLPGSER